MKTKYDALEELATKAKQGTEILMAMSDVTGFLEAARPEAVLGLIADVRALAEALAIARGHIAELCQESGHSIPQSGMRRIDAALSRIQEAK